MAITAEMAKEFANEPAVFSNTIAAGTEIEPKHIEHPMFLSDMVSSNLFTLEEALTIGQVLGIKTEKDCDCLLYTSPSPRDRTRSRMPSSA